MMRANNGGKCARQATRHTPLDEITTKYEVSRNRVGWMHRIDSSRNPKPCSLWKPRQTLHIAAGKAQTLCLEYRRRLADVVNCAEEYSELTSKLIVALQGSGNC